MNAQLLKDFALLIPYYNNPEGLRQSLQSVQYDKGKFEVVIVDDGSRERVYEEELKKHFPELVCTVLRLDTNQGVVHALNAGLSYIKKHDRFNYIARLDCGDTCDPARFYKQVGFLQKNPDIALLGTWCLFENSRTGQAYRYTTQTKHEDIVKEMAGRCSFIHPTVMFRKTVMDKAGLYPDTYPHAEDYAFFHKIMKHYRAAILPEILVTSNIQSEGISAVFRRIQLQSRLAIVKKYTSSFGRRQWGTLKLYLLLLMPYRLVLWLKLLRG